MKNPMDQKMEAQMEQQKAKLAELKAKLKEASADSKMKIKAQIDELEMRMQRASR